MFMLYWIFCPLSWVYSRVTKFCFSWRHSGTRFLSLDSYFKSHSRIQIGCPRYFLFCLLILLQFSIYHTWILWPNMKTFLQEPVRSSLYDSDEGVSVAYSDLMASSKETLDSILELQEVNFFLKFKHIENTKLFSYVCLYLYLSHANGIMFVL